MRIVTRKTLHSCSRDSLRTSRPARKGGKAKLVARPSRKTDAKGLRKPRRSVNSSFRGDSVIAPRRTRRIDSLRTTRGFKPTRYAKNYSLKKDSEDEVLDFVKELIKAKITAEDIINAVKSLKSDDEELEKEEEDLSEEDLDEELESSDEEGEVKDLTPSMGDSLKSIGALARKTSTNDSASVKEDDAWAKRLGGM